MQFGSLAGVKVADPTPFLGTGSRSFDAWVKTPSASDAQVLFAHYECGWVCNNNGRSSTSLFQVLVNAQGQASLSVRGANASDVQTVDSTTVVADDTWHHVAAVLDLQQLRLVVYVDGVEEGSMGVTADEVSPLAEDGDGEIDSLDFGARRVAGSLSGELQLPLLGAMDEVALYDAALSPSHVSELHARAADGRCSDLDGDGFDTADDCGPADPSVYPGAADSFGNGVDEDCDGSDGACLPVAPPLFWLRAEDLGESVSDATIGVAPFGSVAFGDGAVGRGFELADGGPRIVDPGPFLGTGSRTAEMWMKTSSSGNTDALVVYSECSANCPSASTSSSVFQLHRIAGG
jgi:hypothetical protein